MPPGVDVDIGFWGKRKILDHTTEAAERLEELEASQSERKNSVTSDAIQTSASILRHFGPGSLNSRPDDELISMTVIIWMKPKRSQQINQ